MVTAEQLFKACAACKSILMSASSWSEGKTVTGWTTTLSSTTLYTWHSCSCAKYTSTPWDPRPRLSEVPAHSFFVLADDFIAASTVLDWHVFKHSCRLAPDFFYVLVFVAIIHLLPKTLALCWSTWPRPTSLCQVPFCGLLSTTQISFFAESKFCLVRVQLVAFPVISIIRWKQQTSPTLITSLVATSLHTRSCVCNHSRVYFCVAPVDFWRKVNAGLYSLPPFSKWIQHYISQVSETNHLLPKHAG